jgi:hypothetical protein
MSDAVSSTVREAAPPALWQSHWPAEDGGPARRQQPHHTAGLAIARGERLELAAVRDAPGATMVVLRDPGEVFLLRHTIGRRPLRDPCEAWVERIDPLTLEPLAHSPMLPAGPFWPGGLAAHANGSLHVVFGRHCHRLSSSLEVLASRELPRPRPYNSFVVLPDGTLATKDLDLTLAEPARLTLLDPDTLEPRCAEAALPEPAIARLSAHGNEIYVVGASAVHRYRWDGVSLERDERWHVPYLARGQSHGWDPVIAGGHLWFMDNGAHDYTTTMRGAGRAPGPVHLIRVSLDDPADRESVEVSGLPRGTITNPPVYDARRRIAVAYDSGNGVVQAFSFDGHLEPLWRRELDHAAHMVLHPDTGELVLNDFKGPAIGRTAFARAVGRRSSAVLRSKPLRRAATRASRDEVVLIDVRDGAELGRAAVPTLLQSVLFPAPGLGRELYWCTMAAVARVAVA